jgi:hypothetical protein
MRTTTRKRRHARLALCLLLPLSAGAQEISEASYIGSMEGAAQACAAAFPNQAREYLDAPRRLVACHLNEEAYRRWHARLRASRGYTEAVEQGRRSLDSHPGNRERQCRSLQETVCGAGTKPGS